LYSGTKAYIATLEKQLSQLRAEISNLYRSQSQSTNRQLDLTDALRAKDVALHQLTTQLNASQATVARLDNKEKEQADRLRLQNDQIQRLHDELLAVNLELSLQVERNKALEGDNASLLQRWIDRMNDRAERMNAEFEEEQGRKGDDREKESSQKEE
jgi:chromosome segregation ATPase